MIDRQEVMEMSREFGLDPNVVEKDYVLGWMLAAISSQPELNKTWVFKGGTCLKKCFFETYRFSEDLDYTLMDSESLNEKYLVEIFRRISEWIYEASGIEIPKDTIRFEIYTNARGKVSAQGRIGYRGPMQRRGDPPRIKFDFTADEILVLEPILREVHHPYSDRPADGIHARCYAFEEVFAEKIRALAERERPRDLYDVVHLYRHDELRPDRALVFKTLGEKCAYKGIRVPTMGSLEDRPERAELEAEWENMLAHQLPELPSFEAFWKELPSAFEWLHNAAEKLAPPTIPLLGGDVDDRWRPPAMIQAWYAHAPIEIIRFAAANRLCVELNYVDADGARSRRLIEPYSLRRTLEGNLLLYAVKHDTGEIRSYRVDRIEGAGASKVSFVPRYAVELTPAGLASAPLLDRGKGEPRAARLDRPIARRGSFGLGFRSSGPTYVIQCIHCGKKFDRKTNATSMNSHKDKHGYPCPGRTGCLVDTKY